MEISSTTENNVEIVAVKGKLDAVTASDFDKCFVDWFAAGKHRYILDFSGLDYISSAGLRCVLTMAKKLKAVDGKVVLASLTGTVKEVFDISGFDSIFTICDSKEEALKEI